MLEPHDVSRLVDVRTIPRSQRNPQFNTDTLPRALREVGIGYLHVKGLGGLRHPHPDSVNIGWRNLTFRGYADYLQTPEFKEYLQELILLAEKEKTAIMCSEALPWRCHRSLIADALLVRGVGVEHIMSGTRRQKHVLTPWASVRGTEITYPPEKRWHGIWARQPKAFYFISWTLC
ncbi:MAG: DUF488 domain-containing protein [Thaumarchaeota archaeon]|nr:DUF488 domain-containing protein [Nitrososphaerota archaeon]